MNVGLDSATPPSAAQVAAAGAAGVAVWGGYLASQTAARQPGRSNNPFKLYNVWYQGEFAVVKALPGLPLAFCSGWDSPVACKALAAAWGVRLCLDVEGGIRGDGPWVQAWLDASDAGLYGTSGVHPGRRAAFHIAAWYVSRDPSASWPASWPRPATPCGWQWQNTHNEFGVGVDRSWLDDAFGGIMGTPFDKESAIKLWVGQAAASLGIVLTDNEVDAYRLLVDMGLGNQQSVLAKIKAEHPVAAPPTGGPTTGTISGTIKLG